MSAKTDVNILIVGSGLAGMGAALEFTRNWQKNVNRLPLKFDIFESCSYIGGRVNSHAINSADGHDFAMVELGAAWFHSILNNVLLPELAREPDALYTQQDLEKFLKEQASDHSENISKSDEEDSDDDEDDDEDEDFFEDPAKLLYYMVDEQRPAKKAEICCLNYQRNRFNKLLNSDVSKKVLDSFEDCYDNEWNYQMNRFKKIHVFKRTPRCNLDALERCLKSEASFHEGTDDFKSIGIRAEKFWEAKGTDFTLPELIGEIRKDISVNELSHLCYSKNMIEKMWKLFKNNIYLQRTVQLIKLEQNSEDPSSSRVSVTFSDLAVTSGQPQQQKFYDHVIFTGSLSCLQDSCRMDRTRAVGQGLIFDPALDKQKTAILNNYCQLGAVEKIFFRLNTFSKDGEVNTSLLPYYPQVESDWKRGDYRLLLLLSNQALDQHQPEVPSCMKNVYFVMALNPQLSDLMIVLSNRDDCADMLALNEAQLQTALESFLMTVFGWETCEVTLLARSEWSRMPSIGGAYSSFRPNCPMDACKILAAPICDPRGVPRVLFAGEHTHPIWTTSMHGAFDSGRREARRIADLY